MGKLYLGKRRFLSFLYTMLEDNCLATMREYTFQVRSSLGAPFFFLVQNQMPTDINAERKIYDEKTDETCIAHVSCLVCKYADVYSVRYRQR